MLTSDRCGYSYIEQMAKFTPAGPNILISINAHGRQASKQPNVRTGIINVWELGGSPHCQKAHSLGGRSLTTLKILPNIAHLPPVDIGKEISFLLYGNR